MSKLVTIFGGSGFVGRYIARRMAQNGWRVRVAVRNTNEAMFVRTYGVVGQVEPVFCNIRDDASVAAVTNGADAVVNCVGVLAELRKNTFAAVQAEGGCLYLAQEQSMVAVQALWRQQPLPAEQAPWQEALLRDTVHEGLEHQALRRETERLQALTQRQNAELASLNGELEQRVGGCVEAARLDIDRHRQEAPEPVGDARRVVGLVHSPTSRQPTVPPARSGTISSPP
jgi:hypothetical protein